MKRVAIIRCEKNMDRCPLTNWFKCLTEKKEGFATIFKYHKQME